MSKMRFAAAILLALPLLLFGVNYFLEFFPPPEGQATQEGLDLLDAMREGGVMVPIALSHVLIGVLLLIPRTRFAAGLLNLPMSIGIVAFHLTMMPEGNAMALIMLVLNFLVVADRGRLAVLLR